MDPLESIKNLTNSTPSTLRWWVCPVCKSFEEIDMAKALPKPECPGCGVTVQRVSRPSLVSAQEAIKNLENAERLQAMNPGNPSPSTPAPAPVEPKLTATKDAEQPASTIPEKSEPKETKRRGARSTKTSEIPATLVAAAQVEVVPTVPVADEPTALVSEAAAARAAALAAIITKHKLTEHSWIRLGSGRVLSHGFTVWSEDESGNRKPSYTIRDLADSGEYAQSLKQARASDGSVATDVVVVTQLPPEIRPLVWNGELIASLRDGSQTHAPKVGQTVQLSVKVSRTGRLVWCVSGVA